MIVHENSIISFRKYNQGTIDILRSYGLEPYIGQWGTRLQATVNLEDNDREKLIGELNEKGYFPTWPIVFENQSA